MNSADSKDWRQKYAEAVRSFEAEERHYREQVQSLRRLLARLCLLAQGQSAAVDAALQQLKTILARDDAGSVEFDALCGGLANALHTLERAPATAASADNMAGTEESLGDASLCTRIHGTLARILEELRADHQLAGSVDTLQAELPQHDSPATWPGLLARIGELITRRIHTLDQAHGELQSLLTQLAASLDQMVKFAAGDAAQLERQARERDTFANTVAGEVQALSRSLDQTDALADLRQQLGTRLASIAGHLQLFRQREAESLREVRARNAQMQQRIQELEGNAERLQQRLQQEQRAAMLDSLTGIPNRLAWELRSAEELERWQRHGRPTCIAVWDVDHFKSVNDECGHAAGDRALKHVADCLRKHLRGGDFLARYGGEEFVMLLPGTTLDDAMLLAERIRTAVTQIGFHVAGKRRPLGISCGLAALHTGDDAASAFERADAALYRAKAEGRNRVCAGQNLP